MHTGSLEFLAEGLEENDLYILTEFFKMLGNPTRIHILLLLMEQDSCVSNLAEQLGMTQSAVSHQLSLLKTNKLVRRHRDGKMIFYTLTDDHVRMVIKKGMEHILKRQRYGGIQFQRPFQTFSILIIFLRSSGEKVLNIPINSSYIGSLSVFSMDSESFPAARIESTDMLHNFE